MLATVDAQKPSGQDFEEIYRTHYKRVLNLCRYLLNSPDKAEDAAHEAFMRAHAAIDSYNPAWPLSSWLLKITSNYCVDLLRRRTRERRILGGETAEALEVPSNICGPLSEVLVAEQGQRVRVALSSLPEKYRVPLVLAFYNELDYSAIGEILGVERTQVALLIFRGKQQLRQRLSKGQEKEKRK